MSTKRIYVGNIPYSMSNNELEDMFKDYGQVTNAKVVVDKFSGRSKGFGFVEMTNAEADAAIESLNGREVGGRTLRVAEAQPPREGGGGGGGGGDRGPRRDRGDRDGGGRDGGGRGGPRSGRF